MSLLTLTTDEHRHYLGVIAFVRMLLMQRPCRCSRYYGERYINKHLAISHRDIRLLYEQKHQNDDRANKRIFKLALKHIQYGEEMHVPIGHTS
jgi:hypothetical protein